MQTFLPQPDFKYSATVLDKLRLGKQRVEAAQILSILLGVKWAPMEGVFIKENSGRATHPAVAMWRGHEGALSRYITAMCNEWFRRGYNDSIDLRVQVHLAPMISGSPSSWDSPAWLAGTDVCSSHRAVLLAKDHQHYSKFGWRETPAVKNSTGRWPYVWPVSTTAQPGI